MREFKTISVELLHKPRKQPPQFFVQQNLCCRFTPEKFNRRGPAMWFCWFHSLKSLEKPVELVAFTLQGSLRTPSTPFRGGLHCTVIAAQGFGEPRDLLPIIPTYKLQRRDSWCMQHGVLSSHAYRRLPRRRTEAIHDTGLGRGKSDEPSMVGIRAAE